MAIVQAIITVAQKNDADKVFQLLHWAIAFKPKFYSPDPNVDVIYVSPVPVNEEMMQYYAKLLGLKGAIETGNVEDQADLSTRYKIIVPEAVQSFPVGTLMYS